VTILFLGIGDMSNQNGGCLIIVVHVAVVLTMPQAEVLTVERKTDLSD